jgi:long-chain acyl-CoA synthetase
MVPVRETIGSYVRDFESLGSDIAFTYARGLRRARWTYTRVAHVAYRFARELEARGVAAGDRVVIWGRNSPEWVAAFYGCVLRGAVAVPLDEQSPPDFVGRVVEQVRPKLLVGDRDPGGNAPPFIPLAEVEEVVARHPAAAPPPAPVGREDTAEIVFTSGTTATPRGVRITHGNLLANLAPLEGEIKKYLKWERLVHPIRFLDLLPLSHVFGQFMGVYVPQLVRGEVVFSDSLSPSHIVETVKTNRVSVIVAVPRILQALRGKIERDYEARGRLAELERKLAAADGWGPARRWWEFRRIHATFGFKFWAFVSGGATLDEETERFWRRLGFAIVQGYGMTETASLITVNHPFKMSHGSIGKVMAGQEVKVDEKTGEILVRGPNITPGYWADEGDGGGDGGWFRTGDVGAFDEQGNLYFKGRKKDVIVTGAGMNVYPEDLEAALNAQPEVLASAVVGLDGPAGPEPAAAIILRGEGEDAAAAVARANASLAEYQQIRRWVVWPDRDFPRTATHKVRKPAVADAVRAQLAGGPAGAAVASPLADLISRVGGADPRRLDRGATLSADLNLDSLARVELMSAIEERYQVDIDEGAFTAATTVQDLERIVREGAAPAEGRRYPYPRWAQRWPVTWLRTLVFHLLTLPAARLMSWPAVRGREHVAKLEGPVLFVSNHIASADAGLIMVALPFRFRRRLGIAMEGEVLAGYRYPAPGLGLLTRARYLAQYALVTALFNVFPLPQRSGFRRSFAFAGELVDKGSSVLVFPEGRRTPDGRMHEFRSGIGILTQDLGLPVVPARIDGLYELKVAGRYFSPPGSITITFGEPVTFDREEDAACIARELERRVAALERPR